MANALGELFSDIANAIREKTGNPGMMKPIEFPEQIATIDMGADTFDATATEYDLASGATAYVGGEKITGALEVHHTAQAEAEEVYDSGGSVKMSLTNIERAIYDSGAVITVSAPLEEFGDATAEDVAVGKTFTSADGMLVVGTGSGSGGGGSSDELCYVTFMSHDGTEEYGKKAVAVGDDCADPITRGVFSTPTRESTDQYNYTFAGWSTQVNGGLDSNALKAVEEDRTVYANFKAVVRCYTIRFFDGETLLESKSVAYGAMPSIEDPEKSGYSFDCWNPEIVAVTGDADYYAQWTMNLKFANASWADIATVAESGNAANVFALGDTRTVPILFPKGNTYDVTFEIVGFNHDNLSDGSGKAGITVISKDIIPTYQTFGGYEYYFGVTAWPTNAIRTALNGDVFNGLPADLQPHIKTVSKISADASKTLHTTDDKVWIPSGTELGARAILSPLTQCVEGQGEHYPHFVAPSTVLTGRLQSANLNKTVHPSFTSSYGTRYGTRSPSTAGTYYNIFVNDGVLKASGNQMGDQFVYGFCI